MGYSVKVYIQKQLSFCTDVHDMLCPWPNVLFLCVIGSDQDESNALSSGAVISIAVVVTFVVAFILGNISGALILYCTYSHEVLVRRGAAKRLLEEGWERVWASTMSRSWLWVSNR